LWKISEVEMNYPPIDLPHTLFSNQNEEKAEFIMPDRVTEILEKKKDVSLDDVLS